VSASFSDVLRRRATEAQEVRLAGICGQTYVRAALDPRYASPDARDRLVRSVLSTGLKGAPTVAAAAIAGWVQGHPDPVCSCPMVPEPAVWSEEYRRWLYPSVRQWDAYCPVERHQGYARAMAGART
jgi:hypothetical protein